ncbi:MAG: hypothetical protein C4293_08235 [Nitrospiraceae bacterium]
MEPAGTTADQHVSIVAAAIWMIVLSLALFLLPAINGLIAGAVGGYLVGTISRALAAAILPALAVALGLWVILALLGLPVIGFFAGTAVTLWIVLSDLELFLGAFLGGAIHQFVHHG